MAKKKRSKKKARRRPGTVMLILGAVTVLLVAGAAATIAFGGSSTPKRRSIRQTPVVSAARQVTVEMVDLDFQPRILTIAKGATVTWVNHGDLPHNATDDRGAWSTPTFDNGGSFDQTYDVAGVFYYSCTIHHGMQGTLTVTDSPGTAVPTASAP